MVSVLEKQPLITATYDGAYFDQFISNAYKTEGYAAARGFFDYLIYKAGTEPEKLHLGEIESGWYYIAAFGDTFLDIFDEGEVARLDTPFRSITGMSDLDANDSDPRIDFLMHCISNLNDMDYSGRLMLNNHMHPEDDAEDISRLGESYPLWLSDNSLHLLRENIVMFYYLIDLEGMRQYLEKKIESLDANVIYNSNLTMQRLMGMLGKIPQGTEIRRLAEQSIDSILDEMDMDPQLVLNFGRGREDHDRRFVVGLTELALRTVLSGFTKEAMLHSQMEELKGADMKFLKGRFTKRTFLKRNVPREKNSVRIPREAGGKLLA